MEGFKPATFKSGRHNLIRSAAAWLFTQPRPLLVHLMTPKGGEQSKREKLVENIEGLIS